MARSFPGGRQHSCLWRCALRAPRPLLRPSVTGGDSLPLPPNLGISKSAQLFITKTLINVTNS